MLSFRSVTKAAAAAALASSSVSLGTQKTEGGICHRKTRVTATRTLKRRRRKRRKKKK